MLSEMLEVFEDATNESTVNAKYTPPKVIRWMRRAAPLVAGELFRVSDGPNSVRWNLEVAAGQATYAKPPHMGEVLRMAKVDSSGRMVWRVRPLSRWNPSGPTVTFDGPSIHFEPVWQRGETLQVWYIPNGEFYFAEGPCGAASDASAVVLGAPTLGTREPRENAYAGYVLEVEYANGLKVHRAVDSSTFDGTTHTVNVSPDLATAPGATDTYSMQPIMGEEAMLLIAIQASIDVLRFEGMKQREAGVTRMWQQHMRQLRLSHGNLQNITGTTFADDGGDAFDDAAARFLFETID